MLIDVDQHLETPAPALDDLSEPLADRVAVPQQTLVTPDTGARVVVVAAAAVSAKSSRRAGGQGDGGRSGADEEARLAAVKAP